jgi:branched-subunit amino acid aminotransferase/4-amino-4-deoxychorismate lyase
LVLRLVGRAVIPVQERVLKKDDLNRVSELFLTGTTSEVLPIVRVDGQTIGDGRPGEVTRRLQEGYRQVVREQAAS